MQFTPLSSELFRPPAGPHGPFHGRPRALLFQGSKVLAKKELAYVPIIGWMWYFTEMVFCTRKWEQDRKTVSRSLLHLRDYPEKYFVRAPRPPAGPAPAGPALPQAPPPASRPAPLPLSSGCRALPRGALVTLTHTLTPLPPRPPQV